MLQIKTTQQNQQNQQDQRGVGLNIQAHMRDLLMSHTSMDIQQAQSLADMFAQKVTESDWLETSTGLTFEKSFDPIAAKQDRERQKSPWPADMMNRGTDQGISDAAPGI